MSINKAMVVCIIKPSTRWFGIGNTRDYLMDLSKVLKDIEEKDYFLYSQNFTAGEQNHEKMAFTLMTSLNNDEIYKLVNDICGECYEIHILN